MKKITIAVIALALWVVVARAQTGPTWSQIRNKPITSGTAAPAGTACDASTETGTLYIQTGAPATVPSIVWVCNGGGGTYAWEKANIRSGTTAPAVCTVGELFFDTDATAGSNVYGCTATDTWTAQGGSTANAVLGASSITTSNRMVAADSAGVIKELSGVTTNGSTTISATTFIGALTGNADTATSTVRVTTGTAAPSAGSCDAAGELGGLYVQTTDPASGTSILWACHQSGASSYAWEKANIRSGTTAPATCTIGELFFDTDASAGLNVYGCTATDTWTAQAGGTGGSITIQLDNTTKGTEAQLDIKTGTGITRAVADAGSEITEQADIDTAVVPTIASIQAGTSISVTTTGTSTVYVCALGTTLTEYTNGMVLSVIFDEASGEDPTINCDGLGDKKIYSSNGTSAPAAINADELQPNNVYLLRYNSALDTGAGAFVTDIGGATGGATTSDHYLTWLSTCKQGNPATSFELPATYYPTAACVAGTNTIYGVVQFAENATSGEAQSVQGHFPLVSTDDMVLSIRWRTSATSGDALWRFYGICVADAETGDPSFNTVADFTVDTAKGTTLQWNDTATLTITTSDAMTGCAAGEEFFFKLVRDATQAGDTLAATADLIWLKFKQTR